MASPSNNNNNSNTIVTPWNVEGTVKYNELVEQFGVSIIDQSLIDRFEKVTGKPIHPWIKRGLFFSHRHLDDILNAHENHEKIFIYTGRGPSSEAMHLGHMIPFMFTKWLQDVFDCYVIIQISDDEKFYFKKHNFETIYNLGFENSKDIIAIGFNPEKTFIFSNRDYRLETPEYEVLVAELNKKVSFHWLTKIFGFDESANVGMITWPIYQTVAGFSQAYPHLFGKEKALCLVAYAIDQDPYFRLAREIAKKLGEDFFAPCSIIGKFIPPLTGDEGKMSSSTNEKATLFLTDSSNQIANKVNKFAYSGGGGDGSLEDHRKYGGNIEVDIPCIYLSFFEYDDEKLETIERNFQNGTLSCGEIKKILISKLQEIIQDHQTKRATVTEKIVKYFYAKYKYMSNITTPFFTPTTFSFPGTVIDQRMSSIVSKFLPLQLNNIGTHTYPFAAEGGFDEVNMMEREYIYWIGRFFYKNVESVNGLIDGYMGSGGTEANIQGLWVHRNRFRSQGIKDIYVYYTKITHYSVAKGCDLLSIDLDKQVFIPIDSEFQMDKNALKQKLEEKSESTGVIVVLTLGATLTGTCDKISEINEICSHFENVSIHIDACFGGFVVPFLCDEYVGFENSMVLSVGLDAHKMGNLPYPAGIFLCRKNLLKYVETHVDYLLGHTDTTLIGSRPAIPAILGYWYMKEIGAKGQVEFVKECIKYRNILVEKLTTLENVRVYSYSEYTNEVAISFDVPEKKRADMEFKYWLRYEMSDGIKIYKIIVMPHTFDYIDEFVECIKSK